MKKHKPTEETRKLVKDWSKNGVIQDNIAKKIGVSDETLRKYYRDELDVGTGELVNDVANKLLELCMGGNAKACMFILEKRGAEGWSGVNKPNPKDKLHPSNRYRVLETHDKQPPLDMDAILSRGTSLLYD